MLMKSTPGEEKHWFSVNHFHTSFSLHSSPFFPDQCEKNQSTCLTFFRWQNFTFARQTRKKKKTVALSHYRCTESSTEYLECSSDVKLI